AGHPRTIRSQYLARGADEPDDSRRSSPERGSRLRPARGKASGHRSAQGYPSRYRVTAELSRGSATSLDNGGQTAREGSVMSDERTALAELATQATATLLRELVAHLRQNRTQLREEWVRKITGAQLLTAMSREEIFAEATSVYDSYVEALETGTVEALQAYSRNLSERIIPRGVETNEVVGIVLLLRDVLARSLFAKYHADVRMLNLVLDAYEPAANRIAITVAVGFVQQ